MVELDPGTKPILSWVAHPARCRPGPAWALLVLLLVLGVLLGVWMRSVFWGIFAGGILFLSLESFFLPTRYELGETELSVRKTFSSSRSPWENFRRVYEDRHGLTLSPYRRRTALEPYRSQRILFDGGDPEAIRAWVRQRCPQAEWIVPAPEKRRDVADRPG